MCPLASASTTGVVRAPIDCSTPVTHCQSRSAVGSLPGTDEASGRQLYLQDASGRYGRYSRLVELVQAMMLNIRSPADALRHLSNSQRSKQSCLFTMHDCASGVDTLQLASNNHKKLEQEII